MTDIEYMLTRYTHAIWPLYRRSTGDYNASGDEFIARGIYRKARESGWTDEDIEKDPAGAASLLAAEYRRSFEGSASERDRDIIRAYESSTCSGGHKTSCGQESMCGPCKSQGGCSSSGSCGGC